MSPLYQALKTHRKEIRLLVIAPGLYEEDLSLELVTVSLLQNPCYDAISYCWADDEHEEEVVIAGERRPVRKNVIQGIRRLRSPHESRFIWIDAICINQFDYEERGHQVAMMVDVYSQAALVHIWLGEDFSPEQEMASNFKDTYIDAGCEDCRVRLSSRSSNNLQLQRSLSELKEDDSVVHDALHIAQRFVDDAHLHEALGDCQLDSSHHLITTQRWMDAMKFLVAIVTRPWWRRVWVLQEVILPRTEPLVHFSKHTFGLGLIVDCCSNCIKHVSTCCLVPGRRTGTLLCSGVFQGNFPPESFSNVSYLQTVKTSFDRKELGLWGALEVSRMRDTTDLRDHFYGILGLVETFYREMASPDYQSSTAKVFGEATALVAIENRSLKHLRYAVGNVGYENSEDILPSWTIDLANARIPSIAYEKFHAYGTTRFREHWSNRILNGRSLYVYAIYVGTVSKVWRNTAYARRPWDQIKWLSDSLDGSQLCGEKAATSQQFWRVLMHGQYNTRDRRYLMRRLHTDDMKDIIGWWQSCMLPQPGDAVHEESMMTHAVIETIYRNRLDQFESNYFVTDTGHLGARIGEVKVGDGLYVLTGGEAPVILRPTPGPDRSDIPKGRSFAFCGQCYIDEMMDGEALSDGKSWESVVLC